MFSTAFLLAASMVIGQAEETPSAYEHLKPLEGFIGTWRHEGVLLEDSPGIGPKGAKGIACISWKWIYGKNAIQWEWTFDFDGKKSGTTGLIMWDAAQEQMVGHGVSYDGTNIHVTATFDRGMTCEVFAVLPDGKRESSTELYTLDGPDSFNCYVKNRQDLPDVGPIRFQRVK